MEGLGLPHTRYPVVHVAGTNGKGSVVALVAQVLQQAGFRVGMFTSPHIHDYCERININGRTIDPVDLAVRLRKLEGVAEELVRQGLGVPTEFELLTAVAFEHFAAEKVDIAVIETGMGGIYDSTNVVQPEVAAITNVDMDHMQHLGSTVEEIARNKAGIAKSGIPVVCGVMPQAVFRVIKEEAEARGASVVRAQETACLDEIKSLGLSGYSLRFYTPHLGQGDALYSLPGRFQLDNLLTALTVLDVLKSRGWKIARREVVNALKAVRWPGRLEKVYDNPEVIVDVGHNPAAAQAVAGTLNEIYPERRRVLVVGMLDDKEGVGIFKALRDNTQVCIVSCPDSERAENWRRRADEAKPFFPKVLEEEKIEVAVDKALKMAGPNDYVLVTGSFYTVDKARAMFTQPYR